MGYSSCTRNGDHVGLLIKTGNTDKKGMISQTIILTFQNVEKGAGRGETHKRMKLVVLIIKEMSYLVEDLFDDL